MQFPNCPLCGTVTRMSRRFGDERNGYADTVTVQCVGCGCNVSVTGDTSKGGYANNENLETKLHAKWGKRTTT